MVLAYHVICTAYGFWLPNDPRGSWSDFVGAWELFRFGRATKVDTRKSVARVPHDRTLRLKAKRSLKYKPVRFTGAQARAIGIGFGQAVTEGNYVVHACAILHAPAELRTDRFPFEGTCVSGPSRAKPPPVHESRAPRRIASHTMVRKSLESLLS
jgi:hypothetical protein